MNLLETRVCVTSKKYDGSVHRKWSYTAVARYPGARVLWAPAGRPVVEASGSRWATSLAALAVFWSQRWYNVICLLQPESRQLEGYYCNIASPVKTTGHSGLEFIDFDLDVAVAPSGQWELRDQGEFFNHARSLGYTRSVLQRVRTGLTELCSLVSRGRPPFNTAFVDKYTSMVGPRGWNEQPAESARRGVDLAWWKAHGMGASSSSRNTLAPFLKELEILVDTVKG